MLSPAAGRDAIIYLDNAATSWPKPPCVAEAMVRFLAEVGANPGRAAHRRANEAAHIIYDVRERIAALFNCGDPQRVAFGPNVTEALNLTLAGTLKPGDHVITSSMEHNSMMRPLRWLERGGVDVSVAQCSADGFLEPADIRSAVRRTTKMIAVNHASNVTGSIAPVRELGAIAREYGLLLLVDAAQSGGVLDIDMRRDMADLVAFTGHKSLYGPMGTGGLAIGERVDIAAMRPLKRGGTGSRSQYEEQPDFTPDAFESGTPNVVGLAGLAASVQWLQTTGIAAIRTKEQALTRRCINGLRAIDGVRIYGPGDAERQVANVCFTVRNADAGAVARILDERFGVLCRAGLHCSPSAHRTMGTFPNGTVRFSIGYFTTEDDVDAAVSAVESIARGKA